MVFWNWFVFKKERSTSRHGLYISVSLFKYDKGIRGPKISPDTLMTVKEHNQTCHHLGQLPVRHTTRPERRLSHIYGSSGISMCARKVELPSQAAFIHLAPISQASSCPHRSG